MQSQTINDKAEVDDISYVCIRPSLKGLELNSVMNVNIILVDGLTSKSVI